MDERDRDIYEWGELERDCERAAQFTRPKSILYRVFMWIARISREEREALRDEKRREQP